MSAPITSENAEFPFVLERRTAPEASLVATEISATLATISQQVRICERCPELVASRRQTVFGCGPAEPDICFFGEAPGESEDRIGQPFVGAAGKLLDRMIAACGLERDDVYILNALKCRPPANRKPKPQELASCAPWWQAQLALLRPAVIFALGATAVETLFGPQFRISDVRGRVLDWRGIPVVCSWHPAFVLRDPSRKKDVWQDLKTMMRLLGRPLPQGGPEVAGETLH